MEVTVNDIHDMKVKINCINVGTYVYNQTTNEKSFDLIQRFNKIIEYIVKLERENCGLKEYKKHQERANERRYHTGDESWHRGSVVVNENKKKRKWLNERIEQHSNVIKC